MSAQEWLRNEWSRTGLSWAEANDACGVKNAATRKYLTKDHLWYFPPADVFEKLAIYANEKGDPNGRPYFSFDGVTIASSSQWEHLRAKFRCEAGVTNVWHEPAVRGSERVRDGLKAVHPNQKPLNLMKRIIKASSDEGDIVWEPFGGLCTGSIAASMLGRKSRAAEIDPETYLDAQKRVEQMLGAKGQCFP
jgi:site-specific DNA-methyltransferase (adenine-specific)